MGICDFCVQLRSDSTCAQGLDKPKRMGCRLFEPGLSSFCAKSSDFVDAAQLVRMAKFFGIRGAELKKVTSMAREAEADRNLAAARATALANRPLDAASAPPAFAPSQVTSRFGSRLHDVSGGRDDR